MHKRFIMLLNEFNLTRKWNIIRCMNLINSLFYFHSYSDIIIIYVCRRNKGMCNTLICPNRVSNFQDRHMEWWKKLITGRHPLAQFLNGWNGYVAVQVGMLFVILSQGLSFCLSALRWCKRLGYCLLRKS